MNVAEADVGYLALTNACWLIYRKALDPLQRMLLEASYEAFENGRLGTNYRDPWLTLLAGIRMEDVAGGDTGIFIGTFCKDWENITTEDPDAIPM